MSTDGNIGLRDFFDVLSHAIEGSGTGIWDRDLLTDVIRYSPSWFAILGYDGAPPANHIEVSYTRVHPDDLGLVRRQLDEHFAGRTEVYEVEHRLRAKDGSYKWVLSRGRIIARASDGTPLRMAGTSVDITTTRELNEALAAAHRLARVGSWRWDPSAKNFWFSPQTWTLLGREVSNAPVSYAGLKAMYHPDDYERTIAIFGSALINRAPVIVEYRIVHPDGHNLHVLTHAEPVTGPDGNVAFVRGTTQDITSIRMIEAALRESEDHYRHLVDLLPQIPWTAGPTGEILEVGPQWYAITGMTIETSTPEAWINAVHEADRPWVAHNWSQMVQSGGRLDIEYRVDCAAGDVVWMRARAAPRLGPSGEVIRWYGTLEDVTEKRVAQENLRYAAEHDVLTGALNRAALFAELAPLLAENQGAARPALLCLDLDYFKDINDSYGHPVGDELLRQLVARIEPFLGTRDRLARSGGDEFMIILAQARTPAEVSTFAGRIAAAMLPPFAAGGLSLHCSVSIGATLADITDTEPVHLYRKADLALYAAKSRARGSHLMFNPDMQRDFEATRRLRLDLSAAIARDQLFIEFQPIVQIANRQIVGVEALLRWQHPELGRISPAIFIPLAEETGLIVEIGAWVLREAVAAARGFPQNVKISVNVSPRQFEFGDIEEMVAHALAESGLAADRLKLEVTESVLMQKPSGGLAKLHALRAQGVNIVLDDFGTGFSSLSYLDSFRFDIIKIDKSFLNNIRAVDNSQPIFEAIIAMSRALKIPVTAEGVETQTQLDYITRLGCAYVQGYFFAHPMPLPALLDLLRKNSL